MVAVKGMVAATMAAMTRFLAFFVLLGVFMVCSCDEVSR
jgi:hypothetical protein